MRTIAYWIGIAPLVLAFWVALCVLGWWEWLERRSTEECEDCGTVFGPFRWKSDHHGGEKFVCVDRDRCNKRTTGYA